MKVTEEQILIIQSKIQIVKVTHIVTTFPQLKNVHVFPHYYTVADNASCCWSSVTADSAGLNTKTITVWTNTKTLNLCSPAGNSYKFDATPDWLICLFQVRHWLYSQVLRTIPLHKSWNILSQQIVCWNISITPSVWTVTRRLCYVVFMKKILNIMW